MLVLATGARHNYFGNDAWADDAPGLKKIDDATAIRCRLLAAFEEAETCDDPARRAALLTFVVVGGGPTGVEMAGAIAELAHQTLRREFRRIDTAETRVLLVEAGPRLLAAFPERLSERACGALVRLGVEVRLGRAVTGCDPESIALGEERIPAANIVWAAGVAASPAGRWLGLPTDRAGRAIVEPDLSAPGLPEIMIIGDTAAVSGPDGTPVPGVAAAAKQMGRHAARQIQRRLAGLATEPFRYRDSWLARHHRPERRGRPHLGHAVLGPGGVDALGRGAHLVPGQRPQPADGHPAVGMELGRPYAPGAAHHRRDPRQACRAGALAVSLSGPSQITRRPAPGPMMAARAASRPRDGGATRARRRRRPASAVGPAP